MGDSTLVVDQPAVGRVGYLSDCSRGGVCVEAMNLDEPDQPFQLHALANVRPLRPIRVLLAGRDPRYLRVMGFLLARRGYETHRSTADSVLFAAVESFQPGIVIFGQGEPVGGT